MHVIGLPTPSLDSHARSKPRQERSHYRGPEHDTMPRGGPLFAAFTFAILDRSGGKFTLLSLVETPHGFERAQQVLTHEIKVSSRRILDEEM